jgi:hypothetical protein
MNTYTPDQLAEILDKHRKWLLCDGGERADLSYSDLRGSNLSYSDLRGSNLSGSNLSYSDLSGSDLRGSNLSGSDLSGSDLSYSDLSYSDLSYSDLSYSDLRGSKRFGRVLLHHAKWDNLYKYVVEIATCTDGSVIVKMGCKELTLPEWDDNWFNNDNEFPNDGSAKTKHRIAAYQFAVGYARIEGWIDADGKAVIG